MSIKVVNAFDSVNAILRRVYAFPGLRQEKFTTTLILKFSLLFTFIAFPVIIGIIGQLCYSIKSGDQKNALYAEHKLTEIFNMILLFAIFFHNGNKTIKFMKTITESSSENQQSVTVIMRKYQKSIRSLYCFGIILCISYAVNSLSNQNFCDHERFVSDPKYVCGTGASLRFPVELNGFFKVYMQLSVVVAMTTYFPIAFMIPFFAVVSLGLIECRLEHTMKMLKDINFSEYGNVIIIKKKFNECIRYYAETRRLVNAMNDSIGYTFIQQYSMMAVLLALLEYEIIKTKNIFAIFRLVGYLIFEITTCAFGQSLQNQNDKISDVLYNMAWYDMPPELRNNFKFFLVLAQRPMHFLAKPLIVLNYEFLVKILKSSFSFMMFLQTWSKK